jgi:hypothetical protein
MLISTRGTAAPNLSSMAWRTVRSVCALTIATFIAACSSSPAKGPGADKPAGTSSGATTAAPSSQDEILDHYSLLKLEEAANVLKLLPDIKPGAPEDERVLHCEIPRSRIADMSARLKPLIAAQIESDREVYKIDPESYARSHSFEACAPNCTCGRLAEVLNGVKEADMNRETQWPKHQKNLLKLSRKAQVLGAGAYLECGQKQNWFCDSELRNYLELDSSGKPQR